MDPPPQYQAPPVDPEIAILQQKAQQDNIAALGDTARMDTARLAMLYGQSQAFGSPDMKAVMKGAAPMQAAG